MISFILIFLILNHASSHQLDLSFFTIELTLGHIFAQVLICADLFQDRKKACLVPHGTSVD